MSESEYLSLVQHDKTPHTSAQIALASRLFSCSDRQVRRFQIQDPFNDNLPLAGWRCAKDGPMGGSLLLTHVNNQILDKFQLIYGVPKLRYPYTVKTQSTKTIQRPEYSKTFPPDARQYLLMPKWNGSNVLFFKYLDHKGQLRITAKSKGSATLVNTQFGDFLDLTFRALGRKKGTAITREKSPHMLKPLWDNVQWQSISFELCGRDEPHLVDYKFDIALKPLFCVLFHEGRIVPYVDELSAADENDKINDEIIGPFEFNVDEMIERCTALQEQDLKRNEEFRAKRGLKHKYEYNHFENEGRVLYILNKHGYVTPHRTMYKIKPRDVEEVHWETFDSVRRGQVEEAVRKIKLRNKSLTEQALREELDMQGKEWGKFGRQVMSHARKYFLEHRIPHSVRREAMRTMKSERKKKNKKN